MSNIVHHGWDPLVISHKRLKLTTETTSHQGSRLKCSYGIYMRTRRTMFYREPVSVCIRVCISLRIRGIHSKLHVRRDISHNIWHNLYFIKSTSNNPTIVCLHCCDLITFYLKANRSSIIIAWYIFVIYLLFIYFFIVNYFKLESTSLKKHVFNIVWINFH